MRVLIVEDELDLADAIRRALVEEGYACDLARDGRDGLRKALECEYDAVVLDLMLPGLAGDGLLRRLRARRPTPVLVLTARDALADRVTLLDAGADDYLPKPFELEELLARLRALIRRAAREPRPALEIGEVRIDTVARAVTRAGEPVVLAPKEYALLEYLALHRGELVTRTRILEHLYDEHDETLSNVVDVYVSNIRKRLGRDFVRTRRGEGYVVDG
jgi:two-component system OmpR family response regulator